MAQADSHEITYRTPAMKMISSPHTKDGAKFINTPLSPCPAPLDRDEYGAERDQHDQVADHHAIAHHRLAAHGDGDPGQRDTDQEAGNHSVRQDFFKHRFLPESFDGAVIE